MNNLVFSGASLWELESDGTASQSLVNIRVGVESVINTSLLLLIEDNLQDLASILLGAETLSDNLNWVDDIGKDSIVDSSQSSGTRTLLGEGGSGSVGSLWAGKDTTTSKDQDVTVRELLLELTGETV